MIRWLGWCHIRWWVFNFLLQIIWYAWYFTHIILICFFIIRPKVVFIFFILSFTVTFLLNNSFSLNNLGSYRVFKYFFLFSYGNFYLSLLFSLCFRFGLFIFSKVSEVFSDNLLLCLTKEHRCIFPNIMKWFWPLMDILFVFVFHRKGRHVLNSFTSIE